MYILYMGESGTDEVSGGTGHFVLLGLAIPADEWKTADAEISQVKGRYDLLGSEIHTAWMARRYVEQESVAGFDALTSEDRRLAVQTAIRQRAGVLGVRGNQKKIKAYRRESQAIAPYAHLRRAERLQCVEDVAGVIAGWNNARVFAEAISKSDFRIRRATIYESAFEQVLTRYQAFLANVNSSGIIVHDNNTKVAPRLHTLCQKFHANGTFYRTIPNIVETPLFVDSSLTGMIQMADVCSYALRRLLENGEDRLWNILETRVDENRGVKVGVRHYTGSRRCTCRICCAHGRRR